MEQNNNGVCPTETSTAHPPSSEWKPGKAEYQIILTLAILSLIMAIDMTIVIPVLPAIANDLDGSTTEVFWVGSSYLLTSAIFQPLILALSNDFGRRRLLFLSVMLFTLGTIICCLSRNFTTLLAGRCVQGTGGAGILSLNYVILSDIVPLRQRAIYIAITQLSWSVGAIAGPFVGGLFADHTTWRWIFYVNFPFCAFGLVMIPFSINLHIEAPSLEARLVRFDWLGTFLITSSVTSLLLGLTMGGSQFAWDSWHIIVPISIGVIGLLATVAWETHVTNHPMLRVELLKSRSGCAAYTCVFLQGLLLFCLIYYLPVYFEGVKGYSPTTTGLRLIAIMSSVLITGIVTGVIIKRTGKFRWAIWLGWTVTCLASGLLLLWKHDTRVYAWALILVVAGLGHGMVLTSLNICTQALVDGSMSGHAVGMYTFVRSIGLCVGVSVGSTLFQNTLQHHLNSQGLFLDEVPDLITLIAQSHISLQKHTLQLAINQSFCNLAQFMTGLAAAAGLISLIIHNRSIDQDFAPEHILQRPSD